MSNAFATNHHWHAVTVDILPKFKPTLLTDVTRWDYRAYFETHPVVTVKLLSVTTWSASCRDCRDSRDTAVTWFAVTHSHAQSHINIYIKQKI